MRIHLNTMSYVCLLPYHTKQRSGFLHARDDLILNIGHLEYSELSLGFSSLPRASQEESSYHLAGLKLRYKERQMGDEAVVKDGCSRGRDRFLTKLPPEGQGRSVNVVCSLGTNSRTYLFND